jgi:hypothetical protein
MLQLLKSDTGRKLISFVIGLGLAALFRKVCKDGNCVIIQGPPLEEVENKIFKMDSKCYRYKAEATTCSAKDKPNNSSITKQG